MKKALISFFAALTLVLGACGAPQGPVSQEAQQVLTSEERESISEAIGDKNIIVTVNHEQTGDGPVISINTAEKNVTVSSPDLSDMDADIYTQDYTDSPYDAVMQIIEVFS